MRICMIASSYPRFPGDGAARFNHSIAEALVKLGHEVHVLVPHHPRIRPLNSAVQIHPFRYIWPDRLAIMGYAQAMESDRRLRPLAYLLAPLYFAAAMAAVWRLTRQIPFDVIHAHWVIPNGPPAALVARSRRCPLIISLHGSDIHTARRHRLLGWVAGCTLRQARAITACSPDLAEGACRLGVSPERVHLVIWGADPAAFAETTGEATMLRRRLQLEDKAPVILTLGRLVRKKGVGYLVRAVPRIRSQYPDARVVIVGDGPERPELERLTTELGVMDSVLFAGEADWQDIPSFLSLCAIFVAPSVTDEDGNVDGLPTTILEAMAAERPVVASRLAGIPLAVTHEQSGLLVPPGSPEALADAIARLLGSPTLRRDYGKAGRNRVETQLNWRRVAQDLLRLYMNSPT